MAGWMVAISANQVCSLIAKAVIDGEELTAGKLSRMLSPGRRGIAVRYPREFTDGSDQPGARFNGTARAQAAINHVSSLMLMGLLRG